MIRADFFDRIPRRIVPLFLIGLALGFLIYTPFAGFWASLVAYVPFFLILSGEMKGKKRLLLLFVYGFAFYLPNIYWIYRFTYLGIFLVILYQTLFVALLWPIRRFLKKIPGGLFLLPGVWALIEWVKGCGPMGYSWNEPGNAAATFIPAALPAQWGGVHLLTLMILTINYLISAFFLKKNTTYLKGAAALLFILLGSSLFAPPAFQTEKPVRTAMIQPSIDLYAKWDEAFIRQNMGIYKELASLVSADAHLVVWPETAFSSGILWYPPEKEAIVDIIKGQKGTAAHLVGSSHYERNNIYNSLFLVDAQGRYSRYDKIRLLPIAEFLPFPKLTSFLLKLYPIQYTLTPGRNREPFELEGYRFHGIICFESIFSDFVNSLMREKSDFLVISTNDGWFEGTMAPLHHLLQARLRAIEQQKYVAQCANSGISALIDNRGRIYQKTAMKERTVLEGTLYARADSSFYSRHGNLLFFIALFLPCLIPLKYLILRKPD